MNDRANLKGIVIDPGHGGSDPGAVGNGFQEKDLNLKISQYMYDELKKLGIPVTLTRAADETLSPTERVTRVKNAYGNTPDVLVISNHINAAGSEQTGAEGAEVIYALRNNDTLARNILENIGDAGQITRKYYQRRLPSNPSKDYYFMLRDTANTTPVIVEYGFIDNANDINRVNQNYKKYVDAVIDGIVETYGLGGGSNTYTVKSGDSLWKIANQFGTTPAAIRAANNLTSDVLRIGQVLTIPTTSNIPNQPSTGNTYTVQNGDSLWKIANKFGTTINALKSANNLTNDNLQVGQILAIPNGGGSSTYVVKNGDSLWKIANQYGITVNDLKSANGLTGDNLQVGQTLKIPIENGGPVISDNTYTVKNGDSLWSIARTYNTTVDTLRKLNNLTSDILKVGQILKVPSSESGTTRSYTVKNGDSLWKIANEFDTTVSKLRELNGLSSNDLSVGQIIRIP